MGAGGPQPGRRLRLRIAGHDPLSPEGTFYIWCRWASGDAERHWNALADRDVFVLPGSAMNAPGHFRISLTASDEMVERALPAFLEASREVSASASRQGEERAAARA